MSNDFNDFMNTPDDTGMYDTQDIQTNKVWAALSYVGILFILPLLVNGGQSRYAKYHANQGLSCSWRTLLWASPAPFWERSRFWAQFSPHCCLWQAWR